MNNFDKTLYELKLSKITECGVEIETETLKIDKEKYGWHDREGFEDEPSGWLIQGGEQAYYEALENSSKPKLTDNKVTITKIILCH